MAGRIQPQRKVERCHVNKIRRAQTELFDRKRLRWSKPFPQNAPGYIRQPQHRQIRRELRRHLAQGGIHRDRNELFAGDIQPHAQTAVALADGVRQGQPLAPLAEIGAIHTGVDLAVPTGQVIQAAPGKIAPYIERLGELFGRDGGQAEAVPLPRFSSVRLTSRATRYGAPRRSSFHASVA